MGNFLKLIAFMALSMAMLYARAADTGAEILDPWVQAAPPSVKVLAAYMEIKNNGKKPLHLVSITSSDFGQVEIHRSVMHGNMVHMEQQKELVVPPNGSVTLKPGESHLMLMKPRKTLNSGDKVPMVLFFKNGEKISITAAVRSGQAEEASTHQHGDHSSHKGH